MGLYRGKRKRGINFARRKKSTYSVKAKVCYTNEDSPFPKRIKQSPSFRTSTPFKTCSPFKFSPSTSSRKKLFDVSSCDLNDITNEFSVLNISESEEHESYDLETLALGEANSKKEKSSCNEEFQKLIPSVLIELEKAGKGDVLNKFISQVSDGKFPLNNIAFQLWCDVVDWYENSDTRHMRYSPETLQFFWVGKFFIWWSVYTLHERDEK